MRWFKHPADMSVYPLIAKIRSEFGNTGYAAICLMFEPMPYAIAESARLIFGYDTYRERGYIIQEPDPVVDRKLEEFGLKA